MKRGKTTLSIKEQQLVFADVFYRHFENSLFLSFRKKRREPFRSNLVKSLPTE